MDILIIGERGEGKSAAATMLGIILTGLLKKKDKEFNLCANYTIKNYPFIHLKDGKALNNIEKAVVIIDEVHQTADSRDFKEKKNKEFSYFMLQSRKKDIIFLYCTQSIDQVEKRIRNNAEWLFVCQKDRINNKINILMIKKNWQGEYIHKGTMVYNDYQRSYRFYNHKDIIYPIEL